MSIVKRLAALSAVVLITIGLFGQGSMPLMAELQGEHNGSGYGYRIVTLDFNHDGYDDLVVLASFYGYEDGVSPARGKVYVYYGGPGFSSNTPPAMTLEGYYINGTRWRIMNIENVGDVNGDGFDDLMIRDMIPSANDSVRLLFYYGNTDDLSTPDRIETVSGEIIGIISKLGDFDGDGYDDMGIYYVDDNGQSFGIVWGGSFERQFVFSSDDISADYLGITGIGDVNNDGYADFAIGYKRETGRHIIRLYWGNQDRTFTDNQVLLDANILSTSICKALGDVNADGYDDFLGYSDSYGIKLWYGSDSIDPNSPSVVLWPNCVEGRMEGVGYGDFNNDGYDDVISASYHSSRMAVWLGGNPMNGYDDWYYYVTSYDNFGYSVATGDYNADGFCDIAISAPEFDSVMPAPGHVLIYGGHAGMTANDDPALPGAGDQLQLRVSPNPVQRDGIVNVTIRGFESKANDTALIEVFDIKGRRVYSREDTQVPSGTYRKNIQLQDLASGVYICRVKLGDLTQTARLSIVR
jgi:hypothetical protein